MSAAPVPNAPAPRRGLDQAKISEILKRATNYDRDERWMATSDLITELDHCEVLEANLQIPIRNTILTQLEDSSVEVQSVAVKCLTSIVKKFDKDQVVDIVDRLGVLVGDPSKRESRDVYGLGLKSIITVLTEEVGLLACPKLLRSLLGGLRASASSTTTTTTTPSAAPATAAGGVDVDYECVLLDLIRETCSRFGAALAPSHQDILASLSPRLEHKSESIRRRTSITLGSVVGVLNDALFQSLMDSVTAKMEQLSKQNNHQSHPLLFTYIQTVGVVSQSAGVRVGKYLPKIMPMLDRFLGEGKTDHDNEHDRNFHAELWDHCLQTFGALISRCPNEVTPYIHSIVNSCLGHMCYDPNYTYDEDAVDLDALLAKASGADAKASSSSSSSSASSSSSSSALEEDDFNSGGGGWDDDDADAKAGGSSNVVVNVEDDDNSWKVRRAAVQCLAAFIRGRSDMLRDYYDKICDTLVGRFKERDHNVKLAVLSAMADLLSEAVVAKKDAVDAKSHLQVPVLIRTRSSYNTLSERVKSIVAHSVSLLHSLGGAADTQSDSKVAPNKHAVELSLALLSVIRQLVIVRQGGLDEYLNAILPLVLSAVKNDDLRLKGDALTLLHLLIEMHPPTANANPLSPFLSELVAASLSAMLIDYSRIKAQALRLGGVLVRPLQAAIKQNVNVNPLVAALYQAIFDQLLKKDVDQEVKEAALASIAAIIAHFGNLLAAKLPVCLAALIERLQNELTRMSTLRALTTIANSQLKLDITTILPSCVEQLTSFLRKDNQSLRHQAAVCLEALVRATPPAVLHQPVQVSAAPGVDNKDSKDAKSSVVVVLLRDLSAHLSDADLHLAQLLCELLVTLILVQAPLQKQTPISLPAALLSRLLEFIKSPLLQGAALSALVNLFQHLLLLGCNDLSYDALLQTLLKTVDDNTTVPGALPVAQAIAAMTQRAETLSNGQGTRSRTVQRFLAVVPDNVAAPAAQKMLALLVLGEIGRDWDLTEHKGIEGTIVSSFDSKFENVQNAASFALGNLCCGNLAIYVPTVVKLLQSIQDDTTTSSSSSSSSSSTSTPSTPPAAVTANTPTTAADSAQNRRFLLLQSIREIIARHSHADVVQAPTSQPNAPPPSSLSASKLRPWIATLSPLLLQQAEHKDEGVRALAAECLGRLALIDCLSASSSSPATLLQQLQSLITSKSPLLRAVIVTAVRFMLVGGLDSALLREILPTFLALLDDEDLNVRRHTILTINAVVHGNIDLLSAQTLAKCLPSLYRETVPNPKHVRVVDYGPFKVNFDDGLPLRKAAFQCLESLLENAPHRLDLKEFGQQVSKGLNDHDDIATITYNILYTMANWHGPALLQIMEDLPDPIMNNVRKKLKEAGDKDAERVVQERANAVLRSSVRAMYQMTRISGADMCQKFQQFYQRVLLTGRLAKLLKELLE